MKMKTSYSICIMMIIIVVSTGESGPPYSDPSAELLAPVAELHRGGGPDGDDCHFPVRWEGSWFQSGVHQTITINRNTINIKGRCLEADGEKYILFNEKENCFRCVVFHEKHYNLIQYKETFCVSERTSIRNLCSTITGDANLFAMFRLDAVPIDCPFKPPMSFTYNKGHGECSQPPSALEGCLQPSRISFNYQACPDVYGTESTVEELQCLASWKEGSYRYLVGLIQYRHHASYEERFRCFVYEKLKKGSVGLGLLGAGYSNTVIRSLPLTFNSTSFSSSSSSSYSPSAASSSGESLSQNSNVLYHVSMGGDASCNGLTPFEGSRTLTFKRASQPVKQCHFPSFLQTHSRWITLDQKMGFVFNSTVMRVVNGSGENGIESGALIKTSVCSQIVEAPSPHENTLVMHSTSAQCRNGYICSRIVRRDIHIVEIQMGVLTRQVDDACHPINFNPKELPYITLISSNSGKKRCPTLGHFGITSLAQEGRGVRDTCTNGLLSFSVGCSSKNTMQFQVACKKEEMPEIVSEYSCHGWWAEEGINYLITSLTSRSSSRRYCFIYRDRDMTLIPLESKRYQRKQLQLRNSFVEDDTEEEDGAGRVMQFSSIPDSCRRDVSPGIEGFLAFNVTSKGRCNDISGSSIPSLLRVLWLLATIIQMVMAMQ